MLRGNTVDRSWTTVNGLEFLVAVGAQLPAADTVSLGNAVSGGLGNAYDTIGTPGTAQVTDAVGGYFALLDGTTDGTVNYAIDRTTGDVVSYTLDWGTNLGVLFSLAGTPALEVGITFDPAGDSGAGSLWISDNTGGSSITEYSLSGAVLSSFSTSHARNTNLALDPADNTLWIQDHTNIAAPLVFEQYSKTGTLLQTVTYASLAGVNYLGGEFDITAPAAPPPGTHTVVLGIGDVATGLDFGNQQMAPLAGAFGGASDTSARSGVPAVFRVQLTDTDGWQPFDENGSNEAIIGTSDNLRVYRIGDGFVEAAVFENTSESQNAFENGERPADLLMSDSGDGVIASAIDVLKTRIDEAFSADFDNWINTV